jgi:hypothetical protein
MTYRTTAFLAFLLAVAGIATYWYVSRPTPEEVVFRRFWKEFRMSHYVEAQEYTLGDDFYRMAAQTNVRDTDGSEYLIGDYFPPTRKGILQLSIETYVKRHITRWRYLSMDTQRLSEDSSVVHFRLDVAIKDYTSGDIFGQGYSGRAEGTAFMEIENGEWRIARFDLNLFSDDGLALAPYLARAY